MIETKRLYPRELTLEDLPVLFKVLADAETMKHYPNTFDMTLVEKWIKRDQERYRILGFGGTKSSDSSANNNDIIVFTYQHHYMVSKNNNDKNRKDRTKFT